MRNIVLALAGLLALAACDRAKQGAKDALNTSGEIAGKAAGEVMEGVATGVEETWKVDVRLSEARKRQGMALGKITVEVGAGGKENVLVVYLTNAAAINDTLRVMAFDKDSLEMGRANLPINAAARGGNYYEVRFPDRTDLERKSRVVID